MKISTTLIRAFYKRQGRHSVVSESQEGINIFYCHIWRALCNNSMFYITSFSELLSLSIYDIIDIINKKKSESRRCSLKRFESGSKWYCFDWKFFGTQKWLKVTNPLLFLVIPRSPKTCSQNIATFKPFPQAKFNLHFCFCHPWLSFLVHSKVSCHILFWSQRSLIDKQVKCDVLTAKKYVHVQFKTLK